MIKRGKSKMSILVVIVLIFYVTCLLAFKSTTNYNVKISNFLTMQVNSDHDILVRALKGYSVERTPVWLMRQVGMFFQLTFKNGRHYSV